MTKNEKYEKARHLAEDYVRNLRQLNARAEKRGAPKVPAREYAVLKRELARKFVRT